MTFDPIPIVDDANVMHIDFKPKPKDEGRMFELKTYKPLSECQHKRYSVDEQLAEVECLDCGTKLNPVWVLVNMAKAESRWERNRIATLKTIEELKTRNRCKCEKCGEMTRILK